MKDNTIIAEFMGLNIDKGVQSDYMEHELKYHTSWDWLMPVIHKIKESDLDFDVLEIGLPIDETYKAVVEFIKQ